MKDIGNKIRTLREAQNMTQEELAHKVGYKSRVSINKIELQRDIPLNKLVPIAKALGVSPSEILGWDDTEHSLFEKKDYELINKINDLAESDKQRVARIIELFSNVGGLSHAIDIETLDMYIDNEEKRKEMRLKMTKEYKKADN